MKFLLTRAAWALSVSAVLLGPAQQSTAQIIDFETTPSGASATDNALLELNDAYTVGDVSVTFGFDNDGDGITETRAKFEQTGPSDPERGFEGCPVSSFVDDTADPGFETQLGGFFLRQPSPLSAFGKFVIDYSGAGVVDAASGEIWDIDGSSIGVEEYRVEAFDGDGTLLGSINSPIGNPGGSCENPLDGQPWVFQFSGLTEGIDRIEITFIGTKTSGVGLAFNNFDATGEAVPELIYRVNEAGIVWGYPSVADFVANTNGVQITKCTPPSGVLTDRGFFGFDGNFYAVTEAGEVIEYPTDHDLACDTNGTLLGTVGEYADDLGFLAVPEPATGLSLLAGVITLLGLKRTRRSKRRRQLKTTGVNDCLSGKPGC